MKSKWLNKFLEENQKAVDKFQSNLSEVEELTKEDELFIEQELKETN